MVFISSTRESSNAHVRTVSYQKKQSKQLKLQRRRKLRYRGRHETTKTESRTGPIPSKSSHAKAHRRVSTRREVTKTVRTKHASLQCLKQGIEEEQAHRESDEEERRSDTRELGHTKSI